MVIRLIAILFGIGFIFAGVAGFLPIFTKEGLLFGIFEVDSMHNMVHLISGVIAIMAATSYRITKIYFTVFGVIYTLAALIGFWRNGDLFVMHVNTADNILHLVIGVISLYLGLYKRKIPAY